MYTLLVIVIIVEALIIIGGLLKMRRPNYDGQLVVTETEEKKVFSLEIGTDPDELDQKKQIILEVKQLSG